MDPQSQDAPHPEQVAAFFRKQRTGLLTIAFTDLVDSTVLIQRLGNQAGAAYLQQRRQLVRSVLGSFPEGEEIETAGDSFLLVFSKPSDAVRFALTLQARSRKFAEESGVPVQERVGLHLGELVIAEDETQTKAKDLYGIELATCFRVTSLAEGGQILLTRGVFDSARQVLKGEDIPRIGQLCWASHGPYLLKGVEEPVEVCEVAEEGQRKPEAPKTSEKAHRQVRPDEEPVLGWRPAVGKEVPNTPWVLEEKLGEGGFGEVWVAQHPKLKQRRVFKFCFRADRVRALKREITLFRLLQENVGEHPNIVRLHEVNLEQPPFYLEEEYIEGKDLRTWCEAQRDVEELPLETRLEIVAQAADALQAAHDAGIIHRDVKPGNILVSGGISGRSPLVVKLTDFGIGQVISSDYLAGVTKAGFTQTMIGSASSGTGTTMYLAPEIIAGMPATTRSDVYSLGVVLYQLLVGDFRHPLTVDWVNEMPDLLIRSDLEQCFSWQPQERFSSAALLASSLRNYRQRKADDAQRERRRKQVSLRRRMLFVSASTAALLLLLSAVLTYGLRKAKAAEMAYRRAAYAADMNLAGHAIAEGDMGRALVLLDRHRTEDKDLDLRGWEWRLLRAQCLGDDAFILGKHDFYAHRLAFVGTDRLVSGGKDGMVKLWDLKNRRLLRERKFGGQIWGLSVSSSRQQVAVACNTPSVEIVSSETLESFNTLYDRPGQEFHPVAFSVNGRLLAAGGIKGICLWDMATLIELRRFEGYSIWSLAFSPEGRLLAIPKIVLETSPRAEILQLWDLHGDREVASVRMNRTVTTVAFSPCGKLLAIGGWDKAVRISNSTDLSLVAILTNHTDWVTCVAWSPDGRQLASSGADQVIRLWDSSRWAQTRVLQGHESQIGQVSFSPDGSLLASGSKDGTVRIWDVKSVPRLAVKRRFDPGVRWRAVSTEGRIIAGQRPDGSFVLWDVVKDRMHGKVAAFKAKPTATAISDDGKLLVVGEADGTIRIWDTLEERETVKVKVAQLPINMLALSPGGQFLAAAIEADSASVILDVGNSTVLGPLSGFGHISAFRFSEDGTTLFLGTWKPGLYAWDVEHKRVRARVEVEGHPEGVSGISLATSAHRLVTAGGDGSARTLHSESLRLTSVIQASSTALQDAAISPDGNRLLTWGHGDDKGILWDLSTLEQVAIIPWTEGTVFPTLRFSSSADTLIVLADDGRAELLTAPPLQEVDALVDFKKPTE